MTFIFSLFFSRTTKPQWKTWEAVEEGWTVSTCLLTKPPLGRVSKITTKMKWPIKGRKHSLKAFSHVSRLLSNNSERPFLVWRVCYWCMQLQTDRVLGLESMLVVLLCKISSRNFSWKFAIIFPSGCWSCVHTTYQLNVGDVKCQREQV